MKNAKKTTKTAKKETKARKPAAKNCRSHKCSKKCTGECKKAGERKFKDFKYTEIDPTTIVTSLGKNISERLSYLNELRASAIKLQQFFQKECEVMVGMAKDYCKMAKKFVDDRQAKKFEDDKDAIDTDAWKLLLKASKYAIDPGELSVYHAPNTDTPDSIGYHCWAKKFVDEGHGCGYGTSESFHVNLYKDFKKTVEEFDNAIGRLTLKFMTKEDVAKQKNPCKEPCKDTCKKGCKKPCEEKIPGNLKKTARELCDKSKYFIPVKRLQIVPVKIDKKSRKYVYELRFFEKDFTKVPKDKQNHEKALFRVKMTGDTDPAIVKRFDTTVAGLKTKFALKK